VPKQARTLPQMLQQLAATGNLAAQYSMPGRVLCSGCQHQFHLNAGTQSSGSRNSSTEGHALSLPVAEGHNSSSMGATCLTPVADFQHVLWSTVFALGPDHSKAIVDPMSVIFPGVHTHAVRATRNEQHSLTVPATQVRRHVERCIPLGGAGSCSFCMQAYQGDTLSVTMRHLLK